MKSILEEYAGIAGSNVIDQLRQLVAPLKGVKVVHVNSTRKGGGVAEILAKLVPLKRELGIDVSWEVIGGDADFFKCTKGFHNALQGNKVEIPRSLHGPRMVMLFTEGNPGKVRINLRSKAGINVLEFAKSLGGGGHQEAAGVIIEGSVESVMERVMPVAEKYLDCLEAEK